ncbi:MAG TPA: NUDIX domain-containing protein [Candidatus Saccharimonadales bacterium]|nr:NUDIX domain-containing protein [Candidatus Saccharimonadales bacterium]
MNNFDLTTCNVSPLTLIFLVDNDKILTLKRNPDKKIYPGKISGFGGKVEPGEDLVASARREFTEETGLTAKELSLRGTFIRILDTGYINEIYIFVAQGFSGELHQDSGEGIAQWLTVDDFLSSPDIVDHIPLYLKQVIESRDFYCGIGRYVQNKMVGYTDNQAHFAERVKQ